MLTEKETSVIKAFVAKMIAEKEYLVLARQKDEEFKCQANVIRDQINLSHKPDMDVLTNTLNAARVALEKACE